VAKKRTIFISYSHVDIKWLERLQTALAPLTKGHRLDPWDDQRIKPGADWRKEIDSALAASNAAVLLVTQAFFASEFIIKKELPVVLRRRKRDGLPVVWIPISATSFGLTALKGVQAAHDPSRPLDTMPVPRRNKAFVEIVERISAAAATLAVGDVLRTTDAVTPAIMSMATGSSTRQRPGIVTRQRDGRVELHSRDGVVIDVIDPPDLSRLSEAERQLIATYQASMAAAYSRWQVLYPRRDWLTTNERARFQRARRQMCDDLGKVIQFLDSVGKYLPDHYRSVRFECEQLQRSRS
jgi:TIR domain-containing protein